MYVPKTEEKLRCLHIAITTILGKRKTWEGKNAFSENLGEKNPHFPFKAVPL